MQVKNIIVLFLLILLASCDRKAETPAEKPLARVYDLYLYPSDLAGKFPAGIPPEDSLKITRRLVEEWTRERLMLKRAEQYLSENEKNVDRQIEEYRLSLLTFKYKQNLLSLNLDTVVTGEEIKKYYEEYSSNYILDADVVKVTFIKVPVNSPSMNDVRRWYRSSSIEDIDLLEKYCLKYADHYIIQGESWIRFTDLIKGIPLKVSNPGRYLSTTSNIEVNDSSYNYFIHINEKIPESQVAPVDLVADDIHTVILNKRKFEFIQDLENSVYKDGMMRNQIEIF